MFVLESKVEIGDLIFNQVVDIKIRRSVDLLSDTAVIKLPTKFVLKDTKQKLQSDKAIKVGNPVTITLAYKGKFERVEFRGVVTSIKPTTPVEIQCEDNVWFLRRKTINNSFYDTTLKDILTYVVDKKYVELSNKIPNIPVKQYVIKRKNSAQALIQIQQDFGLNIYLDDEGKLFAGLVQTESIGDKVVYDLNYNIVSQNLKFVNENDVKIKIVAKAFFKNNTHIEVVLGDLDGEERTWHTHTINDEETLKKVAQSKLNQLKYSGYDGDIKSFLIPFADRGMTAQIIDEVYPEREGLYFIPSVNIHFGTRGARRIITLGSKLSK
jgi:hypothetical protein